jgi:hypothetical protein
MAQYLFGNNGTTYNVELTGGVAYLDTKGFVLESYGAKGDGSTDDSAAFVAAHAAAVAAGGGVVFGAPGKTYVLDSGVTWNATRARFDGLGCTIDASSLKSGAAFTVDGPTEQYNHIYGFDNCKVVGPGEASSVTAFVFAEATGSRSSKCSFNNVHVEYFGKGFDFQTGAFLTSLFYCQVRGCGVAINCESGYSVYGENINLYGCTLFNGGIAIVNNWGGCDFNLYGCSLDYNDRVIYADGGKVKMYGGHIEWSAASTGLDAPFYVGEGARVMLDGVWVGAVGTQAYGIPNVVEFDASVTDGREGVLLMTKCHMENLESSSGDFAYGDGRVIFRDNFSNYHVPCDAYATDSANLAVWGSFNSLSALPSDVYIYDSASTPSGPHAAGTSDSLSIVSSSLEIVKENGAGSLYKIGFLVPLANAGQYMAGWRMFIGKPNAGGGDITAYDDMSAVCVDRNTDDYGRPVITRIGTLSSRSFTITDAVMSGYGREYQFSDTRASMPSWATHILIVLVLTGYNGPAGGPLYIDNFSVTGV